MSHKSEMPGPFNRDEILITNTFTSVMSILLHCRPLLQLIIVSVFLNLYSIVTKTTRLFSRAPRFAN